MPLKILQQPKIKNILAIAAGKGGVGKSTVTVQLGLALKHLGARVGILDSDIYGPSIRNMLPEERPPQQVGENFIPALCKGIKMMSMAYFRGKNQAAAVRAPVANGIINQFLKNVEWGDLDFLLIDFPPGTGDIQLTLAQQAQLNGALLVTTPQEVALLDVRKALNLFQQVKVPILGVVENMSYYYHPTTDEKLYLFGRGGGERLAQENSIPYLGEIPIDPEISHCGDTGRSLRGTGTVGEAAFVLLAESLLSHLKPDVEEPIKKIELITPSVLRLEWADGFVKEFTASELQKHCPCAGCKERGVSSYEGVCAVSEIRKVGRYAIRLNYTKGCSHGLYSYELLKELAHV